MVWHAMHGYKLLALASDDAGDVFLKFFLAFRCDEILASLDGEDDLNVDLGVGVGHGRWICSLVWRPVCKSAFGERQEEQDCSGHRVGATI